VETEWDNIYISELPANADTDELVRGSNLAKAQVNVTQANIVTARAALQQLSFAV
jgi:uncharacterized protein YfeS